MHSGLDQLRVWEELIFDIWPHILWTFNEIKWTFVCSWWGSFSPQLRRYGLLHMVSSAKERNRVALKNLPLLLRYIRKLAKIPSLKQVLFLISCKSSVADTSTVSGSVPVELGSWQEWCSHQMRDSATETGENLPCVSPCLCVITGVHVHDCQANHARGVCTGENETFGTDGKGGK